MGGRNAPKVYQTSRSESLRKAVRFYHQRSHGVYGYRKIHRDLTEEVGYGAALRQCDASCGQKDCDRRCFTNIVIWPTDQTVLLQPTTCLHGTSWPLHLTRSGQEISRICGQMKAGCTLPSSWICSRGVWWVGQCQNGQMPNWPAVRWRRLSSRERRASACCIIATKGANTPAKPSPLCLIVMESCAA